MNLADVAKNRNLTPEQWLQIYELDELLKSLDNRVNDPEYFGFARAAICPAPEVIDLLAYVIVRDTVETIVADRGDSKPTAADTVIMLRIVAIAMFQLGCEMGRHGIEQEVAARKDK